MTNAELRTYLPPGAPVYFADATYAKPTLSWLKKQFWTWYQGFRWEMNLNKWTRKNDCDNFARSYAQAAQDCHSLSQDPGDNEGLAVGEFWYHKKTGGAHAVIIAVTDQGRIFIEPQNNEQLVLTESEISTCFYARF